MIKEWIEAGKMKFAGPKQIQNFKGWHSI